MSINREQVPLMPSAQPHLTRLAERLEYRRLLGVAVVLLMAALAGWLYLRQASAVASYTYQISQLEARKTELRQEIQHLESQAAQATTLARLQEAAPILGFRLPVTGETAQEEKVVIAGKPGAEATVEEGEVVSTPAKERNPLRRLWLRFQAWLHAEPGT